MAPGQSQAAEAPARPDRRGLLPRKWRGLTAGWRAQPRPGWNCAAPTLHGSSPAGAAAIGTGAEREPTPAIRIAENDPAPPDLRRQRPSKRSWRQRGLKPAAIAAGSWRLRGKRPQLRHALAPSACSGVASCPDAPRRAQAGSANLMPRTLTPRQGAEARHHRGQDRETNTPARRRTRAAAPDRRQGRAPFALPPGCGGVGRQARLTTLPEPCPSRAAHAERSARRQHQPRYHRGHDPDRGRIAANLRDVYRTSG